MARRSKTTSAPSDDVLAKLSTEDLNMVLQFVLLSGSVKDLAARFGVSYPTMRARLDQLIGRVEQALKGRKVDPMAELLADLVQEGQLTVHTAKRIKSLHHQLLRESRNE